MSPASLPENPGSRHEGSPQGEYREAASPFGEFTRNLPTPRRPKGRWRSLLLSAACAVILIGASLAYYFLTPGPVDPNAPRVRLEVQGMHCPLQCGLRVKNALESLPWVLPDSVTANPGTGVVTFAVTDGKLVETEQVRQALKRVGFGLSELRLPQPKGGDSAGGRGARGT